MQVFLRILKEIGIAIAILAVLLVLMYLLFKNTVPFLNSAIPNPVVYNGIDSEKFQIEGAIEDQTDPTKIYQNTNAGLRFFEDERRVKTGLPNPFSMETRAEADMPSEKVTFTNDTAKYYSGEIIEGYTEATQDASQSATSSTTGGTEADGSLSLE